MPVQQKIVYWNLEEGTRDGQMSREEKLARGHEHVEYLKEQGENVLEVIEERKRLVIKLEDK